MAPSTVVDCARYEGREGKKISSVAAMCVNSRAWQGIIHGMPRAVRRMRRTQSYHLLLRITAPALIMLKLLTR